MIDPCAPCVIGVAQRTWHAAAEDAPEPLDMWEAVSRAAAVDSGGTDVLRTVDSLQVVYPLSWVYDDAAHRLAERLELRDGDRYLSGLSGTTPQHRLQKAAEAILEGEREMVLVVGGEALATRKRMRREGREPAWSFPPTESPVLPFDEPFHPAEVAHQVFQAYLTFAVFDLARRARLGLTPEENQRRIGALLAPMTAVAAANPYAWFRKAHSISDLIVAAPSNRMVAYPYTKNTIAIMDVDMAAAVLVTSHAQADALGVPLERRVYLRGWCYARDPVYVAERIELGSSSAMREASREALRCAHVGLDEIAYLDLYSCFASSVNFARDALGLGDLDSRPLTVTGGLPYHGGAGNNYLTHSIATLVERLRADPSAFGMVSGVGMHMTNHVFGIYSGTPGAVEPPDEDGVRQRLAQEPRRSIRPTATGHATLAAYSVLHDRQGPVWGLAVCDLPEGDRCYARIEEREMLEAMEQTEWVGRDLWLVPGPPGVNRVTEPSH